MRTAWRPVLRLGGAEPAECDEAVVGVHRVGRNRRNSMLHEFFHLLHVFRDAVQVVVVSVRHCKQLGASVSFVELGRDGDAFRILRSRPRSWCAFGICQMAGSSGELVTSSGVSAWYSVKIPPQFGAARAQSCSGGYGVELFASMIMSCAERRDYSRKQPKAIPASRWPQTGATCLAIPATDENHHAELEGEVGRTAKRKSR